MNYSFEYIDIILLAMIAGFIFLRLRGILGKRTGFDGKSAPQFESFSAIPHAIDLSFAMPIMRPFFPFKFSIEFIKNYFLLKAASK